MPAADAVDATSERVRSAGWARVRPVLSVLVATCDRAAYLPGLLAALAAQEQCPAYEVVVVDDGSTDGTWAELQRLVAGSAGAVTALRAPANLGAGRARNRAAAEARGTLLAITDDDCLPTPEWLAGLAAALADPAVVLVQGRTEPEPGDAPGPWARSLWVTGPTPWFETCNIAYRRSAFDAVGGFDETDRVFARSGKGFGEDTWLGSRVLTGGGTRTFAPDAVVHHRWRPATYRDHLRERRLMRDFPALVRRVPGVAAACWGPVFLSRRTAAVDLAAAGVLAAAATRRPLPLVAALPWLRDVWAPARARRGPLPLRLLQAAGADLAGLAALAEGSVAHRRLVL